MSRKRKSIISLVTVALLSMCLALPVFVKAEARLQVDICPQCKQKTAVISYNYSSWQQNGTVWHNDHSDVKYRRYKYRNIKCNSCTYKEKDAVDVEEKVVCPNN